LKARLDAFCVDISTSSAVSSKNASEFASGSGRPISYSVEYACKKGVILDPEVWPEWWTRQEKPRILAALDKFTREYPARVRVSSAAASESLPVAERSRIRQESALAEGSTMSHILEIVRGVMKGAVDKAEQASLVPVEVGVFVIRKRLIMETAALGEDP